MSRRSSAAAARGPRRLSVRPVSSVESLERRVVLDATYHPLASGSFVQNWSNTGLITTADDWSGVPSIVGFRGDGLTTTDGVDPQTVVAASTVVDVNANQTNPNTNVTGGVAEFQITDPVVALQGSGTADAPYLQFHVDTTGVSDVRVSYVLRDIDGSADDAVQAVALQYRVGETGDFINVPAGFVADASTGPNLSTLITPVSVVLPAAAGNQGVVQIRVITTNAVGSDEWVGVDDITIEDAAGAPGNLGFFSATYSVGESDGNAVIRVERTGGSLGEVTVRYSTVTGGTATPGVDYTAVTGTLTFDEGQTTRQFNVPILNDGDPEPSETVNLLLDMPGGGAGLGLTTAVLTILDNDALPPTGVLLNEVLINPPGSDEPNEYVEIRGGAGQALTGIYFVSVEGDGTAAGTADLVVDLSATPLGSNGLLMIKAPAGGFTPPSETTVVPVASFANSGGILENGSNSFVIVFSTTPILAGVDYDANNDGFLELPPGAVLVDGIGYTDGGATDVAYGAILTQPTGTPQAATRFPTNTTPLQSDAWYNGGIIDTAGGLSTGYNPANASSNLPTGAVITPGDVNFPSGDTTPPTVTGAFVFDAYPTLQTITLSFSEDVQASLSVADDITLFNSTTSTLVPAGDIALAYDTGTNVASLTFPNYGAGILPDGNYTLILAAGSVQDAAGNALVEALNLPFFVFGGDADRNRVVSISDFSILASRFNLPGTFSQGDFTYDGQVGIADFSLLASKFNQTLPAPFARTPLALAGASPTRSPFGLMVETDDRRAIGLLG